MTTLTTSAGPVAYESHSSGDPIVLLPSDGQAAVAAELTALANTAFAADRRMDDIQYSPPAPKEQEQS